LNYPYYAFFACFLILVSSLLASISLRNYRELRGGLLIVGAICLATVVNLTPTFYSWAEHGPPRSVPVKRAAEAEEYGLTIRHLVSPVQNSSLPLLRDWTMLEQSARYPLENENTSARLGLVGSVGFIALLGALFVPRLAAALPDGPLFLSAGRLTLATLLLGTIGGFGSVFNLLIAADIRAYNRVAPFIAFLSLVAVGMLTDVLLRASASSQNRRRAAAGTVTLILFIGLYDQGHAAMPMNLSHQAMRTEWTALSSFVDTLEGRLPTGAMVFQLPAVTFLNESGREQMRQFDHIKLYLPSTRLHWSYPALSDDIVRWQQQVARLPTRIFTTALTQEGFNAILIDRNGYADRAQSLLAELGVSAGSAAILAADRRYVALDLRLVKREEIPSDQLPRVGATPTAATLGLPRCVASTPQTLEWVGATGMPFDEPHVHVPAAGEFAVTGWAVDGTRTSLARDVDIIVGDRAFPAFYGIERLDVAEALGNTAYRLSGFTATLAGADVGSGPQVLSIRVLASDHSCYFQGQSVWIETRGTRLTDVDSERME
jgi:phosphoglycerol transferase